jgi:hypothetical protein
MGPSWAFFSPLRVPPYVTRLEDSDGLVGRHYFRDLARAKGGELTEGKPGTGILRSVTELKSDHFDPGKLAPEVRDVWERTTSLEFRAVRMKWNPWMKPFEPVYRLIARAMQQMDVPEEEFLPNVISSHVSIMDEDRDGDVDYRIWLRALEGRVFYVGAVFTHTCDGPNGRESYLNVILPVFRANVAVVFQPFNRDDGGLYIQTHVPNSYDAGCHLIFPGLHRYWMMPFFGIHEEIRLVPKGDPDGTLEAIHETKWFRISCFQLSYELRPARGDDRPISRTSARSRRRRRTP